MGASKNVSGNCPYCGGSDLTLNSDQFDDRYKTQHCAGDSYHSAKNVINGAAYPLVDPSDQRSGWVVYNPNF